MKVIQFIKLNSYFNKIAFTSVAILCLLIALIFVPLNTKEDNTEAATGTAQESTMTLAMTSNTASVDLAVNSTSGTFAKSSTNNEAAFSVTTNNYTGYTLSISASDDDGTLVNGSNTLSSISSSLSESAFDVAANNGKWGWKPSKLNSSTNTNFLKSPTTEAVTLDTTSAANSTANNYTIALGARADYTKPAGTYTKTFILTAVANKINYSVTYNKNTTDTVTNMPYSDTGNTQSGDTSSTTIALSDLVPVRDGYNFKGWCSTTTSDDTCSGTIYNPDGAGTNLTYGIDQTTINVGTLYAMWKVAAIPMQNLDYSLCTAEGIQVKDTRDGEIYSAKRLADGNCWLLDNLRLDLTDPTILNAVTADNSNADTASITSLKSGNRSAGDQYASSGFATWNSSSPDNVYNQAKANADYKDTTTTSYGSGSGKIGVYYNFCAASAGSYCYDSGASTGNASQDICPKGWRMPTGGNSGEYQALYTAYSSNVTNFQNALSTPLSGYFFSGSAGLRGSDGYFWSATYYNSTRMYSLYVDSSGVDPQYDLSRSVGGSVRCILDIQYLQDQTTTTLAADLPNVGDTKTYRDKRDNEFYLVGHLADGKYWLLDNLRLDLTNSTILANTTADNTNASTTTLNYLKNGGGSTSDQYATAPVSNWTSGNSDSAPLVNTASKDLVPTGAPTGGSGSNKVGGYYNYCAASAGSYCYGNGTYEGTSSGNATEDICPKGWRMPTGGSSGEYNTLYGKYSSASEGQDTAFKNALSTPLSGIFSSGSADFQGSYGEFLSSTRYDNVSMYILSVSSSRVSPSGYNNRRNGDSLRCLLGSNFLQDQTTDTLAADLPNVGDTKTYYDKRDGQGYQVAHLADGKYWMVENLNLAGGTALSADDTDVTSEYISSFTTSNNLTKTGDAIVLPASSTSGFNVLNYSYVFNSGNKTGTCTSPGCYSYYSWDAATLGSGRSITADNTDAPYSICPKGWKLPNTRTGTDSSSAFRALMIGYGGSNKLASYTTSTSPTGAVMYGRIGPNTIPNFLLTGYYASGKYYRENSNGLYWTSTSYSNTNNARYFVFGTGNVIADGNDRRDGGFSIRCLLK